MTKLDQSSEKTKKNVVSAKIKKFTRVVLQTVQWKGGEPYEDWVPVD